MSLRRIASDATRSAYFSWLVLGWCLFCSALSALAQFVDFSETPSVASPATVDIASSNTQRRLKQIETLVASEAWDEAVEVLAELIEEPSAEVVSLPGELFVPLRTYCQMRLAQLPPEALAIYRKRVDGLAADWLQQGIETRDEEKLCQVFDELFCSSSGDSALLALGELALERGDIGAAQRYWESIAPGLRGPAGQPITRFTQDVDLASKGETVRDYLTQATQPKSWLAYPDSDLPLTDVLAKLAVASLRERNFDRAEQELALLRLIDPHAQGRLGGKKVELAPALEELVEAARSWPTPQPSTGWPTMAGNAARTGISTPIGPVLEVAWQVPLTPQPTFAAPAYQIINNRVIPTNTSQIRTPLNLTCHPLVDDNAVLFRDSGTIRAVALATGKPAITRNGVLLEESDTREARPALVDQQLRIFGQQVGGGRVYRRPQLMTVCGNTLLAIGEPAEDWSGGGRAGVRSSDRVLGFDLHRDALLTVQLDPPEGGWRFSGPPICADGRMFLPLRRDDIQSQLAIGCFSAATGRLLWQTSVCSSQTPNEFNASQSPCDLLTLGGGAVFFNTNVGLVAAVEQRNGHIRWLRRYPRGGMNDDNNRAIAVTRGETPCLYHRSALVVAPADATSLFALDPSTGATLWATEKAYDVEHLLGAEDGTVVASGRRLWLLDIATGKVRQRWPDSIAAGIRGVGRGCIAGREIFWPTENAIYVFDVVSGGQSRMPIDLTSLELAGANLVAADGFLILAGAEKLIALGATMQEPPSQPELSQLPDPHTFVRE